MHAARGAPVVGIVGGGQLARMLAEAATPLGIHVRVLAGEADEGAPEVVPDVVRGRIDDEATLRAFARSVDVVTFDHENVDHELLLALESDGCVVRPSVATLRYSDKAHQRERFAVAGLPVPDFLVVEGGRAADVEAVRRFAVDHGGDAVLKASRGGYDGRGVWVLPADDAGGFVESWEGAPLVVEPLLPLVAELAVIVARRPSGEVSSWPVLETVQVDGMCNEVLMPAPIPGGLEARARQVGEAVADEVEATGVVAIELFVVRRADVRAEDGGVDSDRGGHASEGLDVLVNEIAPRVHNSGHLTIEASPTSQFEQHLRAVLDWPLGPTVGAGDTTRTAAAMVNVVGDGAHEPLERQAMALAAVPGAAIHLYGKAARPGRKVGHVTVLGEDPERARRDATVAAEILSGVRGSTS